MPDANTTAAEDPAALDALSARLQADLQKVKKTQTATLVASLVLAVIMVSYLSWLTVNLGTLLNEQVAAEVAASQLRMAVPQVQRLTEDAMLRQVPDAVERMSDMAVAQLPQARKYLERVAEQSVDTTVRELDAKLDLAMNQELSLHITKIREKIRHLSDAEKLDVLEQELGAQFREVFENTPLFEQDWEAAYMLGKAESTSRLTAKDVLDAFHERLQAFERELEYIVETPPDRLGPVERDKRDLILNLTAYMERLFWHQGDVVVEQIRRTVNTIHSQTASKAKAELQETRRRDDASPAPETPEGDKGEKE